MERSNFEFEKNRELLNHTLKYLQLGTLTLHQMGISGESVSNRISEVTRFMNMLDFRPTSFNFGTYVDANNINIIVDENEPGVAVETENIQLGEKNVLKLNMPRVSKKHINDKILCENTDEFSWTTGKIAFYSTPTEYHLTFKIPETTHGIISTVFFLKYHFGQLALKKLDYHYDRMRIFEKLFKLPEVREIFKEVTENLDLKQKSYFTWRSEKIKKTILIR